ncbi:MAG: d(CMP) kinase [Planctomycetota bacterium]
MDPTHDDTIASGIVITIDGPAGTGKSSVARRLAARLGLDFLDTGSMYRAAAAIAIDHGLHPELWLGEAGLHDGRLGVRRPDDNASCEQRDAFVERVVHADLHFDWRDDPPEILAWDRPLGDRIRDADVTGLVSTLAAVPELRRHMVRKQRIIAHQHPRLVSEGRDQGSVAFPDAACKFYLDARPRVRAQRRIDQLAARGKPHGSLEETIAEIEARDASDRGRSDGPLVCPDDAAVLDTSDLSLNKVLDRLEGVARERVPALAS